MEQISSHYLDQKLRIQMCKGNRYSKNIIYKLIELTKSQLHLIAINTSNQVDKL